jgi:hypothetical protein
MGVRLATVALVAVMTPAALRADDKGASDGFTPLFDGKSLAGWMMVNTKENFLVKDGILVMNKGAGWLATDKSYSDFELRIRYRFVTPGADSGVFIRARLEGKNWTNNGYQIQNMDNETLGKVVGMGVRVKGEHKPDLVKQIKKPAGEWMDLVIVARGKSCEVTLNGKTVGTSEDLQLTTGNIGLQAEGGILEFERIDIKPLLASRSPASVD